LRNNSRRSFAATVGSALLISAAVIFGVDGSQAGWWGVPYESWILSIAGMLVLVLARPVD
jgi:ubiquinone biosynthesis protein